MRALGLSGSDEFPCDLLARLRSPGLAASLLGVTQAEPDWTRSQLELDFSRSRPLVSRVALLAPTSAPIHVSGPVAPLARADRSTGRRKLSAGSGQSGGQLRKVSLNPATGRKWSDMRGAAQKQSRNRAEQRKAAESRGKEQSRGAAELAEQPSWPSWPSWTHVSIDCGHQFARLRLLGRQRKQLVRYRYFVPLKRAAD